MVVRGPSELFKVIQGCSSLSRVIHDLQGSTGLFMIVHVIGQGVSGLRVLQAIRLFMIVWSSAGF